MQNGFIIKSELISENELKKINKFTKRDFKSEEVYVFSVVLCDNEIDRDYDRFTKKSLEKLAGLFVGKTGIFDHDAKSEKQTARIFSCETEIIPEINNSLGEPYCRLIARAYIPRSKSNEDFILAIDSGIKKEVSVRCRVEKFVCSICGSDISVCEHKKGREYKNGGEMAVCHALLEEPADAYEWSFVAIPAQRAAGVIKTFKKEFKKEENDLEKLKSEAQIGRKYKLELKEENDLEKLKSEAQIGRKYKLELKSEVDKFLSISEPEIDEAILQKMTKRLDSEELKFLKNILQKKIFPDCKVQLAPKKTEKEPKISKNRLSQFKI